jgi:hypothetical protein
MAKSIRIVPSSGSIYLIGDGYDVTGSIVLQTVDSTEDVQFINGETNESLLLISKEFGRIGVGTINPSAKLEISSSLDEDLILIKNSSGSIKVNQDGILVLSNYTETATPIEGALIYSASNLFIGN